MFANPDPDDEGTRFEGYDLKYLIGTALIGWAIALSIGLAIYQS